MDPAEQTAISSDPPRLSGSLIARRQLGLAETTTSGSRPIVMDATLRSDGPSTVAGPLPAAIGRYQVLRSLGAGGMGEVVLARDPELDRKVAIKLLKAGKDRDDAQVRLLREAQAMARLSHPNVVQIHDVGMFGERVFLAMELIEGETLAQWLAGEKRTWREVVAVFVAAGRGLAAAHAAGLIHRDFKPDNVLLARDGRVCVADFGLARGERGGDEARGENPGERPLLVHTLTATGAVMGTPLYMSPEQHMGAEVGPASDMFSFSVALFEGLYGARPFAGETMGVLAGNVIAGNVVALPPAAVPRWLEAVVRRGLAAEPARRFPDFAALLVALDRDPARTRRRWLLGLGLGIAAGALGATVQASRGPEVCSGGVAEIAEVWTDEARAEIQGRMAEAGPRVIAGLQGYADAWSAMHGEACLAHQRGEASAALLDARMRCLEQRRQGLAGAIEVLAAADATAVREAPAVVAKLTPLAGCADAEALLREVPLPGDAATAAAVEGLQRRLARVKAVADAGRPEQAQQAAAAIRREAEGLGYRPLIAAAWLIEGRAAHDAMAWSAAREAFAQAFVTATAAGDDAIAAEARARQLFDDGVYGGGAAEGLASAPHAEALVVRLGDREDLAALLENNLGVLHLVRGDPAAARVRFMRATALSADEPRTDPIDRAGYLTNAAQVAEDMSERAGLFDQAATLLGASLGPGHPGTLQVATSRAVQAADPASAVATLADKVPYMLAARGYRHVQCVEGLTPLAFAYDELGRSADAIAAWSAAERCLDVAMAPEDEAPAAAFRGLIRGYQGVLASSAATLPDLDAAVVAFAPHAAVPGVANNLAAARLGAARVHVATGQDAAARPLLEQVVADLSALPAGTEWLRPYLLARARVGLAGVLARDPAGDRARVTALLDAAEAVYRGGADQQANLAAIAALR